MNALLRPWALPPAAPRAGGGAQLSPRELALLAHLADGASNQQIARRIGRSEKTVRNSLSLLYQKLDVPNRAAAVAVWLRQSQGRTHVTAELPL